MKATGKNSANGVNAGKGGIKLNVDAIVEHVETNVNCEFVRIVEQFSKMDDDRRKKLMGFAQELAE